MASMLNIDGNCLNISTWNINGLEYKIHGIKSNKLHDLEVSEVKLIKELIFIHLFLVTAAGVVPCGSPKKRPRTSSIVQFIFYVWSLEIRRNILRNQKIL